MHPYFRGALIDAALILGVPLAWAALAVLVLCYPTYTL